MLMPPSGVSGEPAAGLPGPVGLPLPRVEGREKVTGGTRFAGDWMPPGPPLHAAAVRCPWPHARILGTDGSKAIMVPGVRAVLTATSFPTTRSGQVIQDVPLLAGERAVYAGERVAVIVADSPEAADTAAGLVQVDYEPLPAILDPVAALEGPELHPGRRQFPGMDAALVGPNLQAAAAWARGDAETALHTAACTVEGRWETAPVHQGYLEPHTCLAWWEPGAGYTLVSANKAPFLLERLLRPWIGPDEPLTILRPAVGGDFGGKAFPLDEGLVLLLARRFRQPVRMTMTYPEEFAAANPRHASAVRVRAGCSPDGVLTALDVDAIFDGGAYAGHKAQPLLTGIRSVAAAYRVPAVRVRARLAYTNGTPGGYMRAPAGPQVAFAVESALDGLAAQCGLDPREFRRRNLLRPGDTSVAGWSLARDAVRPVLEALPAGAHGYALAEKPAGGGRSGVTARLVPDGRIEVVTSACDPGTGAWTIIGQLAAATLGLDGSQVLVRTDGQSFDSGAAASRVTHVAGQATIQACGALRSRLRELAARAMDQPAHELRLGPAGFEARDGSLLSLASLASLVHPLPEETAEFDGGRRTGAPCYAGAAAWAEVDHETGAARITRLVVVHDTGPVLNPSTATGQAEGAAIMALGQVLTEEIVRDHGRVTTANLDTYRLPAAADIPVIEVLFTGEAAGPGPLGARPVSEVGLAAVAAAAANALRRASGRPVTRLPVRPEDLAAAPATLDRIDGQPPEDRL